jgi:GT2 family glycosyltransferase
MKHARRPAAAEVDEQPRSVRDDAPNQAPLVSVIIPTYERCASLRRALEALSQQTLAPEAFEVVVAIDGSHDHTEAMVAAFDARHALRALWQPNRGRAAAANAAIRLARGDVLVILDDDMEPAPGCLAAHLRAHRNGGQRCLMGAVPIGVDTQTPVITRYVGAKFNEHLQKLAEPNHRFVLRDFYSGNMSIRRELLEEVGLFDEAFRIYGNEDLELSLRLRKAGVRLAYSSDALAIQHYSKSFDGLARDTFAKGRTAVLLARKHPDAFADLQLANYGRGPRTWRAVRRLLLESSRLFRGTPAAIIALTGLLERVGVRHFRLYYWLVLDYFYWLGARTELTAGRPEDSLLTWSTLRSRDANRLLLHR